MSVTATETPAASDLSLKSRRIRARIVRGLVKLAGAEEAPAPGAAPGPAEARRRDLLASTLADLAEALDALAMHLPHAGAGDGLAGLQRLCDEAARVVAGLRDDLGGAPGPEAIAAMPRAAQGPLSALINAWCPVSKIFVAVHGIGDQFQNQTVQSVAFRVCDYVGAPAALPLGRFHGPGATVGAFLPEPDRDPPVDCGFAEIYWANVPRVPAADQHILEDPRKWARTLVERLRLRAPDRPATPGPLARRARDLGRRLGLLDDEDRSAKKKARLDDERLEQLLEELIQGVVVADRLVFLADKAGLFKFDLKKLLNDYLNDVQVVTEFEDYRAQLLDIFGDVLERLHRYFGESEIYIVAHSEGTVVSFMGLLKGLSERAAWSTKVRGLMTIGSPLNKHVRFWPELFDIYEAWRADPAAGAIRWKNYYDYGDPIGYNLQPTRDWMSGEGNDWSGFFAFQDNAEDDPAGRENPDDIGFTRYYFPGAAHNDYWNDPAVFGHFIQEVVDPEQAVLPRDHEPFARPRTHGMAWVTSYTLPYALAALLLFAGCYLLYRAVLGCLDPIGARHEAPGRLLRNVAGLWGLVAGMSLLGRMPCLSRLRMWRVGACVLALASLGYLGMTEDVRGSVERFLVDGSGGRRLLNGYDAMLVAALAVGLVLRAVRALHELRPALRTLLPVVAWVLALRAAASSGAFPALHAPTYWRSLAVVSVAWLIGLMAWSTSRRYPRIGTKPLVHTGGLMIVLVIASEFALRPDLPTDKARSEIAAGLRGGDQVAVARAVDLQVRDAYRAIGEDLRARGLGDAATEAGVARAAAWQAVADAASRSASTWPVLAAGPAFLYLWWLAILTFDMTFVWHLYIRHSGAQRYIDERAG